jgi:gamma-aminobutyric acid type B receptor
MPYECDGGIMTLPETLYSSHSCEWIEEHHGVWYEWILGELPECDSFYYQYDVEPVCDSNGERFIQFKWRLPDASDPKKSIECSGGDPLPHDFKIPCEYVPHTHTTYRAFIGIATLISIIYVAAMGYVYKNREIPIIKRSQYELLLVLLVGAILMNGASIVYGTEPSMVSCGLRPISISISFTLIFGSLFVKSLRVYRVFMQKKAMKKVRVTSFQMVKMLSVFLTIDIVLLVVWLSTDYPSPTHTLTTIQEHVHVDMLSCKHSNFLFQALVIFWKALVLFAGLYITFLIRNVSSDFQESVWIFASAIVVLMGGIIILPLAYLVELPALVFYDFLASMLVFCTASVVALMIVPKILKSNAVAAAGDSSGDSAASSHMSIVVPSAAGNSTGKKMRSEGASTGHGNSSRGGRSTNGPSEG